MLYMIIERFRGGDAAPVYRRFRERGRLAPDGLTYVSSWTTQDLTTCYQVMEAADPALLEQWMAQWRDLVEFEIVPVMTSAEASAAAARPEASGPGAAGPGGGGGLAAQGALVRMFEHNHWANLGLLAACAALRDDELDARPSGPGKRSVRETLLHLVAAQEGYLSLLTLPPEARRVPEVTFAGLPESARASGEGLLAFVRSDRNDEPGVRVRTLDGYVVERWVVILQAIDHATEHRAQVCGMLRTLGVTPPGLDGWHFGESVQALVPVRT